MRRSRKVARPRRRLFWRIYVYGLLVLVAVAVSSSAVFVLLGDPPPWYTLPDRAAALLGRHLEGSPKDAGALHAKLAELEFVFQADLAIYQNDGTLLASAGDAAPPALTPDELDRLKSRRRRHGRMRFAVPIGGDKDPADSYLVLNWVVRGVGVRLVFSLLAILVVVGLVSVPLARSIARPLESLTRTARKLGAGDLDVRTSLSRNDEVGVLARTMDEMAARLDHRIRGEKELLANISHELRTPLARIRVALELCTDDGATMEGVRRHLSGIGSDIGELEQLVDDVLVAARLDLADGPDDGTTLRVRKVSVDLAVLVAEACEKFLGMHPGREIDRDMGELPALEVDPALLRRALDNLLDNAAKYADVGKRVEVSAAVEEGEVLLEVSDRGIGVEDEDLPRLFEPFFRTSRSREREHKGTGLGLTLCKRIIEAHGGSVGARRREGEGMVFWIRLPLSGRLDGKS